MSFEFIPKLRGEFILLFSHCFDQLFLERLTDFIALSNIFSHLNQALHQIVVLESLFDLV